MRRPNASFNAGSSPEVAPARKMPPDAQEEAENEANLDLPSESLANGVWKKPSAKKPEPERKSEMVSTESRLGKWIFSKCERYTSGTLSSRYVGPDGKTYWTKQAQIEAGPRTVEVSLSRGKKKAQQCLICFMIVHQLLERTQTCERTNLGKSCLFIIHPLHYTNKANLITPSHKSLQVKYLLCQKHKKQHDPTQPKSLSLAVSQHSLNSQSGEDTESPQNTRQLTLGLPFPKKLPKVARF